MRSAKPSADSALVLEYVLHSDRSKLKKVLKSRIDPDLIDGNGEPLIFTPIVNGDRKVLKLMLPYINVNIESADCRTPLMLAVEMGDLDIVKLLIKAGARVDCKDNSGKTPLLLALEDGKFKIAEYLIKHGSDVNEVDDLGQSALHLVVSGQHNDCARIIRILFKCRYIMKDVDHWLSPEDLAANQKLQSIYLKQIQNAKASIKVNSMESIAIPRECFES